MLLYNALAKALDTTQSSGHSVLGYLIELGTGAKKDERK